MFKLQLLQIINLYLYQLNAGSTHYSTAFQSSRLYEYIKAGKLPEWVIIAGDEAYSNEYNIVTPYSDRNFIAREENFNHFLSSCRVKIEQAFGILINRFGVFWSSFRYRLRVATQIICVAAELHNFIIETSE